MKARSSACDHSYKVRKAICRPVKYTFWNLSEKILIRETRLGRTDPASTSSTSHLPTATRLSTALQKSLSNGSPYFSAKYPCLAAQGTGVTVIGCRAAEWILHSFSCCCGCCCCWTCCCKDIKVWRSKEMLPLPRQVERRKRKVR